MVKKNQSKAQSVVLFGNGDVPIHRETKHVLNNATSFICLDGGADKLNSLGFEPNIIIGDLDSIKSSYNCTIIEAKDQYKSDLEKGLIWCIKNDIKDLSLVGFSGGRDDHNFLTFFIMLRYAKKVKMTLYSNFSKVVCVKDQTFFKSIPNQTISIIAPDKDILITTSNLEYPLNEEKLLFSSQGISNLTSTGTSYSIKASNWVWVFENYLF